jgi:hypothetical protein
LCATASFAQDAKLLADSSTLVEQGGVITLTAETTYRETPGALGWAIVLPAQWSLVAVSGPNAPDIAPEPDSHGTIEFAHTRPPADRAIFSIVVRYPAGATKAELTSTTLVRTNGRLVTLVPAAVHLLSARSAPPQRAPH